MAEALEYGMVGLNDVMITDPVAPFGGMKQVGPRTERVLSCFIPTMEIPTQMYCMYIGIVCKVLSNEVLKHDYLA